MTIPGIIILVLACLVILGGSRRTALLAMAIGILCLPQTLAVVIGGINFFAIRFLELGAFVRVIAKGELKAIEFNQLDKTVLFMYLYIFVIHGLRSTTSLGYVVGQGTDAMLCYFSFRALITNGDEMLDFLTSWLMVLIPYTLLVLVESGTEHNLFDFISPAKRPPWFRGTRLRCFGSFRQPDTLGALATTFLPLYIAMFMAHLWKFRAVIGIFVCLIIVWATNAGGPAGAAGAAMIGWAFWRYRTKTRQLRKLMLFGFIGLALVMKAPVWYILARVSSVTGGGGWHRAYLFDTATQHIREWWLAGMEQKDTFDWFPYHLSTTGGSDITNQFILFGIDAGIGAVLFFVYLLVRLYKQLGETLLAVRPYSAEDRWPECLLWGFGVMLAVHIVTWMGVSYFDQFYQFWCLQLAAMVSVSAAYLRNVSTVESTLPSETIENLSFGNQVPN